MRRHVLASLPFLFAACAISQVIMLQRRPSVATSFEPDDVAGITFWLKADSGVYEDNGTDAAEDGDPVYLWYDNGPMTYSVTNVSVSSGAHRPYYRSNIQNGKPAIEFGDAVSNSTNYYLTRASIGLRNLFGVDNQSIFAVAQLRTNINAEKSVIIQCAPGTTNTYSIEHNLDSTQVHLWQFGTNTINLTATTVTLGTNWVLLEYRKNSGVSAIIFTNGVQLASDSSVNTIVSEQTGTLYVSAVVNDIQGYLSEIVIYTNYLSDANTLTSIRAYFNTKYNLW